jgi:hypothetical protein
MTDSWHALAPGSPTVKGPRTRWVLAFQVARQQMGVLRSADQPGAVLDVCPREQERPRHRVSQDGELSRTDQGSPAIPPHCCRRMDRIVWDQFQGKRGVIPLDRPVTWTCKIAWRRARPRARSPQGDGELCLRQPSANACPRCGRDARAPRGGMDLQDRVEMRSSPSAEPGGRRGALPASAVGQRVPPMRAGRPRSQGRNGPARSRGDAPGLGRGARRATGRFAYVSCRPTRVPDAGETPALPGEDRRVPPMRARRPRSQGKIGATMRKMLVAMRAMLVAGATTGTKRHRRELRKPLDNRHTISRLWDPVR